jgi:hypothetical protein
MYRVVFRGFAPVAAAVLLAGCSVMPEWTKPSTWYDGVTGQDSPAEKADAEKADAQKAAEVKQAPAADGQATPVANQGEGALPPVEDPLEPAPVQPRIKPSEAATAFPNLSAQPAPREPLSTESQQREIRDSLVADRDRAQHSADELRGGAPAAAPPPPAATKPKAEEKSEEKPADE